MLFLALTIFGVMTDVPAQHKIPTIHFLAMHDGCPNTPSMWRSLNEALRELQWTVPVDSLDVFDLSRQLDPRTGYGAPTILVDGKDLFGVMPETTVDPSCRFYPDGLPDSRQIVARLLAMAK